MGDMISMISHQWKQPLAIISMSINNILIGIELDGLDQDKCINDLNNTNGKVQDLSNTIDNIQKFFNSDSKIEDTEINKVIDEACYIISRRIKANDITLQNDFKVDKLIKLRRNDLIQVILNLLTNSIDAYKKNLNKNKIINISTKQHDKIIEIKIQDTAGGISDDIIDKIFDPYFSTKNEKNATGLGLYMAKMLLESHLNATLQVQTQNNSTTFTILLNI